MGGGIVDGNSTGGSYNIGSDESVAVGNETQSCMDQHNCRAAVLMVQFRIAGMSLAQFMERHVHDFAEACRQAIDDGTITVIVSSVHANADADNQLNPDGTWRASTQLDIGVLLARPAEQGGARTMTDAGAGLAAAAGDGSLAASLTAHAVPVTSVALAGTPQVIEAESASAHISGGTTSDGTAAAGGAAGASATIFSVLGVWGIAVIAVGLVMILSLVAVAAILVHHRRRRALAAAGAAGGATTAATAAPASTAAAAPDAGSATADAAPAVTGADMA